MAEGAQVASACPGTHGKHAEEGMEVYICGPDRVVDGDF